VATDELGILFKQHGSDKSTEHDYYEVYGSILADKRNKPIRILEIGLGTNNLAFQSNMGLGGRPGASLRAFRDWAPKAEVIGADIDRGVLFEEERIKTRFVDQTDPGSLAELASKVGSGFDLIIDDGLHLPHANLNTIEALQPLLNPRGTLVIEDIDPIHLHYWRAAAGVLSGCDTSLVERRGGWLFIMRPRLA
jgi:SAM-dependent methyltransferase